MSVPTPPSFRWPLMANPFTLIDRLAVASWVVRQDRYTMGARVAELERWFSAYSGMHALMVANGSLANMLVFELWRLKHPGARPLVMVPAVTWVSSITPALMANMDIEFCDINTEDFAFDYAKLEAQVKAAKERGREHIIIWPTALIGFAPDMAKLQFIADAYGADLFLDSCENTFSRIPLDSPAVRTDTGEDCGFDRSILASADITTTSTYMGHQMSSIEGGFVFFRNKADYEMGRMFRNHGMARSLPPGHPTREQVEESNPQVDPQFLFALPGTNLRPSDVHAAFGLRDCRRAEASRQHRQEIYSLFYDQIDRSRFYLPRLSDTHVAFCLPIFAHGVGCLPSIKRELAAMGVETRPIIGGCLPLQPIFKQYGKPEDYPAALWVHEHGCYVGLHHKVTPKMVTELTDHLNAL